jgi:hypothetical protein
MSAYPRHKTLVCKFFFSFQQHKYPLGHPDIILDDFKAMDAERMPYFGVVKCDILPPRHLYLPLLPTHCRGKLMFVLCRTCGEKGQGKCSHTDAERELHGEWVTVEIEVIFTLLSIALNKIYIL